MRTINDIILKRSKLGIEFNECELILGLAEKYPEDAQDEEELLDAEYRVVALTRLIDLFNGVLDNPDEGVLYERLADFEDRIESLRRSIDRISDTEDEDMLQELDWRIDDLNLLESEYRMLRWVLEIEGKLTV